MPMLQRLEVQNYRCLRHIDYPATALNVLFGPNGVGKTTFLDALWFVRDCAIRGTAEAASVRHHGIGALSDADGLDDGRIRILIETDALTYTVTFGYSSGRIEPFVGERLTSRGRPIELVSRSVGSDHASFYHEKLQQHHSIKLPDPERLAFSSFLLYSAPRDESADLDALLKSTHLYATRAVNLYPLRRLGSESSVHTYPWDRWQNLWSALRNLAGQRALDDRYDTVLSYMRKAFPQSFKDLVFESIGSDRVGGSFVERGRSSPIQASGVSDGHLQMLGLLTSLFGDLKHRSSLLLFDEPETSLHPHAIAVFAGAVRQATMDWHRQVFVATHSPVLISQFEPNEVVVVEAGDDRFSRLQRLSDVASLTELIEQYSIGSLYMAEEIGRQSTAEAEGPDDGVKP